MDEEAVDQPEVSLLDVIVEQLERQKKDKFLYRLIFVGTSEKQETSDLVTHMQHLVRQVQSEHGLVSGMLLSYDALFIHLVEGTREALFQLLSLVLNPDQSEPGDHGDHGLLEAPPLHHLRVLLFADDVQRTFPFWTTRTLPGEAEIGPSDPAEARSAVHAMYQKFLNLSAELAHISKTELKGMLDDMQNRFPQHIPQAKEIAMMCGSDEFFTLEQFLRHFATPLGEIAETELVWPAPVPLCF